MLYLRALPINRLSFTGTRALATAARDPRTFNIPVINFTKFRTAKSPGEKKKTADEIVTAFKESGFLYLEGHGIASSEYFLIQGPFDMLTVH